MGIIDTIKSIFSNATTTNDKNNNYIDFDSKKRVERFEIGTQQIDSMQRIHASDKYSKYIHKNWYSNYQRMPFISQDREINTDWIEMAQIFGNSILVPKKNMKVNSEGLLPGHVFMLYWINKGSKSRRIPSYFEYKYGINFTDELDYLIEQGYLEDPHTVSELGKFSIKKYKKIIDDHNPSKANADRIKKKFKDSEKFFMTQEKVNQILLDERDISNYSANNPVSIVISKVNKEIILQDISKINIFLANISEVLKLDHNLIIKSEEIEFKQKIGKKIGPTHIHYNPLTKTGRNSKYPYSVVLQSRLFNDYRPEYSFGVTISYLSNHKIGSLYLIIWYKEKGYKVECRVKENILTLTKISVAGFKDFNWEVIYMI